ncbi:glutathione synthase/RimK-type ligase-like ATP-grasp enzyme [Caldalkalibacillus uzonensis]|uniref:Glutathione synthase/RimK-type ligase-like ATP-grasp enzyme n=1 Tax=Caldalkalibacillus uzonensis TaxID=353224 RepID=A0ABU0CU09_9BACI|nr:YheC/YheD family protein [Caldalkalibacillus uzonensis]MDQ0339000.1 glutathione synthase/RimK-type ligase-like ATP-grasp enzyme [Caldalkalibacillus uzonensis]
MFHSFPYHPPNQTTVAVFVKSSVIKALNDQRVKERIDFLRQANQQVRTNLYFFAMPDVDLLNKQIKGTYYDDQCKMWKQKVFPFPVVLYQRRSNGKKQVQAFFRRLRENGVIFLNAQGDFNKWDVYQKLSKNEDMKEYLPTTVSFTGINDLMYMFEHFDRVYVKPHVGRYSRKVILVENNTGEGFKYSYYGNSLKGGSAKTLEELDQKLHQICGNKKLLIQQAIESQWRHDDRIVDFRSEVQRNGNGEVEVVATSVREADKCVPITSTRANTSVYSLQTFLTECLQYSKQDRFFLEKKIDDFLINVFYHIERLYGKFGELGIDFVIDPNGKMFLIEVNARSAKQSLIQSYDNPTIKKAFINPLEYAKFLHLTSFNTEV